MPDKRILIEKAIQAYLDNFDENNSQGEDSERNETIKWTAASTFKQNWDIEAEDLLSMWKKSTKNAFIDAAHSHPTQGISLLLKEPDEAEGIREAFRKLFHPDDGNIDARWDRILEFIDDINSRIERLYPNSKMYLQTKEGVISYLNLWDPDHNYRYKPQPANSWASYIGYGDWTTGQYFSLRKYYKMCDEILEVVKDHEELLRVHRQRFENGVTDCDKELHILTFDVLFCFWGCDDARREAIEEYKQAIAQQHIEELQDNIAELQARIEENQKEIQEILIEGSTVKHKKWGTGVVIEASRTHVTIEFEPDGRKIFQWPGSLLEGFLRSEDPELLETIKKNKVLEIENELFRKEKAELEEELKNIPDSSDQ